MNFENPLSVIAMSLVYSVLLWGGDSVCQINSKTHIRQFDFQENFRTQTMLLLNETCPIRNYSAAVVLFSHPSMDVFCAAWRKGLRRVWNLPYNTHSALLPPLCAWTVAIDG